jgi:Zn-finger nucleic acid-binding protein
MVIELQEPGKEPERSMNRQSEMLCPSCQVPLAMAERQGVEIDYCPRCRGVWLDRGELDKIIERAAAEIIPGPDRAAAPFAEPRDEPVNYGGGHGYKGRYKGKHKRRKSWMSEIFDVFD